MAGKEYKRKGPREGAFFWSLDILGQPNRFGLSVVPAFQRVGLDEGFERKLELFVEQPNHADS